MHHQHHKNDTVEYVSIQELFPGQARYSILNVRDKVSKAVERGDAVWNVGKNQYHYKHHHGTSSLAEKDALPVVRSSFGYVLLDGHHDVLSSIELKAENVPVKVVEDLSYLDREQFWEEAEGRGWSYFYSITGEKVPPPNSFHDLIDDPNRYFAAITARKYTIEEDGSHSSVGAEYPLWVKINKDIPFIEFRISNALFSKGFLYQPETMGHPPDIEILERARSILLAAKIEGLHVVPNHIHYDKLKVKHNILSITGHSLHALPDNPEDNTKTKTNNDDEIKRLKKFTERVESRRAEDGNINFSHGFLLFKNARARKREAKYLRAKQQLEASSRAKPT